MTATLYLVQHGAALPKERNPSRPLSDIGRREVEAVARCLAAAGVGAARVVHSGKARAAETATILAAAIADGVAEAMPGLAPNDAVAPVADAARAWSQATMLVGHLPFLSRLAADLVAGREEPPIVAFRPGAVLCLERTDTGDRAIAWMLTPEFASAMTGRS